MRTKDSSKVAGKYQKFPPCHYCGHHGFRRIRTDLIECADCGALFEIKPAVAVTQAVAQ